MVPWIVTLTLVRELIRVLATPLRVLLYLPVRHTWRRRAKAALQSAADDEHQPAQVELLAGCAPGKNRPPHLFLSAGEASGENHAVRLMNALDDQSLRWTCFGGTAMAKAGGRLLYPLSEHAVMGVVGVLRGLPFLIRGFCRYIRLLRDDPPDLVVLVDYPGLHLVMAKAARRRGIPVLHYIAPQYWAWGPWRMRRYRRSVDATLTILPFEPAFFERAGVPSRYVGHPLLDEIAHHPPDADRVASLRERPLLCVLPGSRRTEIRHNLPGMVRVARALRQEHPDLRIVLPHRDCKRNELIEEVLRENDAEFVEHIVGPLADWLAGARLVLAKSGTGSLEACLHGTPTVVVYRMRGWPSTFFQNNLLSVPYFAAANLVAGRRAVPEFASRHDDMWDDALTAAATLLRDGPPRDRCRADLQEVRRRLGQPGATERAADVVRTFLRRTPSPR